MEKNRPFLKWAGNKYRCLGQILNFFPDATRLIEPFTGSAAVFLNTKFSSNVLAEQNKDLISLFTFLKRDGSLFIGRCRKFFSEKNNTSCQYYQFRTLFNESADPYLRSLLFVYLNRHGYNGLCRYNLSGLYNVPFGNIKKPYFPQAEMLHFYAKSQNAEFICSDFRETFKLAKQGDVIYCDPPYVPLSNTADFTKYNGAAFTASDQMELAELALVAAAQGVTVLISKHDTSITRAYYQQAQIISFSVQRQISCSVNSRRPVKELLAIFK